MRTAALSVLLVAGAAFAPAGHAQEAPTMPPLVLGPSSLPPMTSQPARPPWDGDAWRHTHLEGFDSFATRSPFRAGLNALREQNFARAETVFARIARRLPKRDDAKASFYLGATRMELGKWEEAKADLEFAAQKFPAHPDPKSRLGVTYARLGDVAAAMAQRAELVKMAEACKGDCELAPYIADGIAMIDKALAEGAL